MNSEDSGSQKRRRRLGEVLLEGGLLSQDQLSKALEEGTRTGKRLGEVLAAQDIVSEYDIACLRLELG